MTKKCYLYRIVHHESGKDYIGVSTDPERRWKDHVCLSKGKSRTHFHRALRKYGKEAFEHSIVAVARNEKCALELEKMAIFLGLGKYNMTEGGETTSPTRTPRARAKRKAALKGRTVTPETRARIGASNKGKKRTREHVERMREISRAQPHRPCLPQTRAKIAAAHLGKPKPPLSEEHRQKLRLSSTGRKHTSEAKAKISAWHIGRKLPQWVVDKAKATKARKKAERLAALTEQAKE